MKQDIVLIAHNIRSLWNVGSLFRNADAFEVQHIHLTGYTATPPRKEISKTAIGAENWMPWSYHQSAEEVIEGRRKEGYLIAALEKTEKSIPVETFHTQQSVCIVVGHEVLGVPEKLLEMSDIIVHINMYGKKESLNVSVATGIALFQICKMLQRGYRQ